MTRILADLPEDDIKWLDRLAHEQGKSRAAVLREAVDAYRAESAADWIERGFGLWARPTAEDGGGPALRKQPQGKGGEA